MPKYDIPNLHNLVKFKYSFFTFIFSYQKIYKLYFTGEFLNLIFRKEVLEIYGFKFIPFLEISYSILYLSNYLIN